MSASAPLCSGSTWRSKSCITRYCRNSRIDVTLSFRSTSTEKIKAYDTTYNHLTILLPNTFLSFSKKYFFHYTTCNPDIRQVSSDEIA